MKNFEKIVLLAVVLCFTLSYAENSKHYVMSDFGIKAEKGVYEFRMD